MPFPPGEFINAQKPGSAERLLFIEAESFLLDVLGGNGFKTLPHKTRTHPRSFRDMLYRLNTGEPPNFFSQAGCRPPPSSTSGIRFGKAFSARETSKASFVKDEFHLMLSQASITFFSLSCIMNLHTHFLTLRAGHLGCGGDYLNPDGAIGEPFLMQNMQLGEVQWHHNAFFRGGFFCGMLAWQGSFSLRRLFFFLPTINEGQACSSLSLANFS
jgi:hypothetical protein